MASIKPYKLKNGEIRYEYFIFNGIDLGTNKKKRIHKRGFSSYEEAKKSARILEGKIASGDYFKENPQRITIEQFLNIWITEYKNSVKEGTRIVHRRNINCYINPYIGKYPIDKYKRVDHQKFINQLLNLKGAGKSKNGLSVVTVRNINGTLNNAFKKAIQLGYLKENPTSYVEFPRTTSQPKKVNYYSLEESERFLEFAKKEKEKLWHPFFCLVFEQGLRKAEVMGLRWDDIDFSNKMIRIERERLGAAEKGENKGLIITDDPKTPSGIRELPLTPLSINALLTYRNHILKTFDKLPTTNGDEQFIFVQSSKRNFGKVIRDRSVNGAATRIEKAAGLPHIKVHDGRHTFAVRARQAGVPLEDIKDFLGHKDISTTQIYAHVSPEVKQKSMNLIEEYKNEHRKKAPF